ncbi:MAG: hypothetical protein IPM79_16375 [Polyangiaceae bacterium]|nr:hypothetical protein [Polyangiaceae bacterium]
MGGYDESDLRLRVQASFSLPEMRRLLLGWGATPEEAEGDARELSLRVVRLGVKRFGAGELVHKLKADKPLTEWPDPAAEADERWAPQPPAPSFDVGETTVVDLPPAMDEPQPPSAPASAPKPPPPGPRSNPMVFLSPEELRRRDAPRRGWSPALVGVSALLLVGCVVAAGTMISRSRDSSAAAAVAPGPTGPAVKAASVLDDGLRRVAEGCAIDVPGQPSLEVFALAQEACGREETQAWARKKQREQERALTGDEPDPPSTPFRSSTPTPPVQDRLPLKMQAGPTGAPKAGSTPGQAAPKAPAGGSCVSRCSRTRSECDKSCGREPTDATQYGPFQACASRCVSAETRCRRECA